MGKIDPTRFAELAAAGLNSTQIAREMGVNKNSTGAFAKRHGIAVKNAQRDTLVRKFDPDRLREMIHEGHTTAEIAEAFDVDHKAVIPACRRLGLPLPGTVKPAAKTPAAPPAPQDPRLSTLIATGGRHAALAAWALRWGASHAQARIEWSRLRLPLVPAEKKPPARRAPTIMNAGAAE